MAKENNYTTGQQDAWIEALRGDMREVKDNQRVLFDKIDALSAKVNRVYGGAIVLGAIAGCLAALLICFFEVAAK